MSTDSDCISYWFGQIDDETPVNDYEYATPSGLHTDRGHVTGNTHSQAPLRRRQFSSSTSSICVPPFSPAAEIVREDFHTASGQKIATPKRDRVGVSESSLKHDLKT
jgi:hypothetical protein